MNLIVNILVKAVFSF